MFYVHPYLGKIFNLTNIFFRWVETTNQFVCELEIDMVHFYHRHFAKDCLCSTATMQLPKKLL